MAIKVEGGKLRDDSIRYTLAVACEPGVVLAYTGSGGSGVLEHDANQVVIPATNTSGVIPAGMLATNVLDLDLSRFSVNEQRNEVNVGSPVTLIKKGEVYTNRVIGSPILGQKAYLGSGGYLTSGVATGVAPVGTFGGQKDSNGYIFVYLNIE